jgi:hypothetical protein
MSLILDGSNGLSDVDGSASTPAIRGTDANTGIFFPAADTIAFAEGGTEVARFDSSGNLGIGTTSPTSGSVLDVASGSTTYPRVRSTVGSAAAVFFQNSDTGTTTSDGMYVGITGAEEGVIWNNENTDLRIATNNTERARITSAGDLLTGGTGVIYYSKVLSQFDGSSKYGYTANDTSGAASVGFVAFTVNGTTTTGAIGTITRNGSSNAVLYNTTSDARLKENIADADDALSIVGTIKVRKYDWKEGGQHEKHGFIAQELADVVDNVVTKGRTEEDMWAVDYGKLTPLLCKAVQELKAELDAAKARIATLEAK